MELIFEYKKITLLRWECRNRFKVTLINNLLSSDRCILVFLSSDRCFNKRPHLLA